MKVAKVRELCSLIHAKYDNESDFARDLGWARQKLYKITNGITEPDLYETAAMAQKLGCTLEEMANIFLRYKSPNGQQDLNQNAG